MATAHPKIGGDLRALYEAGENETAVWGPKRSAVIGIRFQFGAMIYHTAI
jgi:hypothetical protein